MEGPWLDASFMQQILRNAGKDESIKVSGITVSAATAKGDNYLSDMHRVTVEFSRLQDDHEIREQTTLIVKVAPQDEARQEMMKDTGLFETEISIISKILSRMNEIIEKSDATSVGPLCYYVQYETPTHIIMEDLATKGFRMAHHQGGLDLHHSLLAIQNLARFHAASVALKEKDPQALTNYKMGIFRKNQSKVMSLFVNSSAKALAHETAKWPELSPRIAGKLLKLSEVLFEKGCDIALHQDAEFNVLNHGDFWVNNMLFHYDEHQKPIDCTFVDFQMSFYGSPALDLLFFFGASPTDDVRLHHRDLLLREYHDALFGTMIKLGCKTVVPSFEELVETLKKKAFYEVISCIVTLGLVAREEGEALDFEEIMKSDGQCTNACFQGKLYRKIMIRLLPWYDSMGLLDA